MIIRRYAFIIIWFVTAVITTGVMAESPLSSDIKSSEELYQQLLSLQAQKEHYEYLRQETAEYRKFLERQQEEHRQFLERCYTIVTGAVVLLATIFTLIFSIMGWKSKKDARKDIKKFYKQKIAEIWDKETSDFRTTIQNIKKRIDHETAYKRAKVLIFASDSDASLIEEDLIQPLRQKDIKNIQITQDVNYIRKDTCDIVIRYYRPDPLTGTDLVMHQIVDRLNTINLHIPLIVYTSERIDDENERKKLYSYRYALPAQFPLTLLHHTITSLIAVKAE